MMRAQQKAPRGATITNGINVTALNETIDAVRGDNEMANFQFRVKNKWMGADLNRTEIEGFFGACADHPHEKGPFTLDNAEPSLLLGCGSAPNPVEYVLHALAGCLTSTMIYHAAARGITVEEASSALEGDLDLRGFLGLSDDVRKGFKAVRVKIRAKSDATPQELTELAKFSPVYDIVSNSLPVEVIVETY